MHPNLTVGANGLVKVRHLPAMAELRVELDVGAARTVVTDLEEVSTYGDDLMDGMTLGSFGPGGGGTGEVRLCTASVDTSTKDEDCATFGYQWTSGTITGRTSPAQRGISMDLEAITANHGADDDDGTTAAAGSVTFRSVQDATYDLTATGTADWAVSGTPTARIWCYHDENADETNESKADSAWVGTACAASQTYNLTQKGLEVRGFVANVSHEHLTVVRGDETFEGAELAISKYVRANLVDSDKPIGGPPIAKTTVQADGSYVFEGLDAGRYVITAVNTSQYEALQSHPTDNVGGAATAAEYVAIPDERLLLGKLPRWDYENSEGGTAVPTSSVTVGTGTNAKTMTFHNFALLHKDGTFSGRVVEASDRHGNIAVELRRCLVYTPADTMATGPDDDVAETCSDDTAFTPAVQQTRSSGTWSYGGLREGYYQVNLAATGYLRARYGSNGIDDDAADCGPGTEVATGTAQTCDQDRTDRQFDDLRGKTAFNETPSVYYVYNGNLSSGDAATAISVSGVETNGDTANVLSGAFAAIQDPQPSAGTEALGAASAAVSFDAASVRVRATVPSTASYVVTNETALNDPTYTPHRLTGAVVPLTYNRTAVGIGPNTNADTNSDAAPANDITITVTAQNGYNDHDYTFTATRTNPIGNQLEAAEVQFRGTDASTTGGNGASGQPFRVTTANATTNSVIVTFDLEEVAGVTSIHNKCAQSVAVYAPGADDAMTAASNADSDFCSGEQYSLSAGSTGTTYTVVITSEDNRDWTYYVNVSLGS
ncbi:MAG: hypothetical protein F4139_09885 [Gemmatimonadetes bacterium]|nr:hypothetical protein [Gemmatimonadota bacterium]MYH53244.1 hypothetical protein [Gemmatimonadota bacterium]MYK65918.1 hypothetical protein [Gemmatimonadota bacterium]